MTKSIKQLLEEKKKGSKKSPSKKSTKKKKTTKKKKSKANKATKSQLSKHKRLTKSPTMAEQVADRVAVLVKAGKRVNLSQIMREVGYSKSSVRAQIVKESDAYKKAISPIVAKMKARRDRAVELLEQKEEKAKYPDLIKGIDTLTRNVELLSGRDTDRTGLHVDEDSAERLSNLIGKAKK